MRPGRSSLLAALLLAGWLAPRGAEASPTAAAEAAILASLTGGLRASNDLPLATATSVLRSSVAASVARAAMLPAAAAEARRTLEPLAAAAAAQHGVEVGFFQRLIRQESGYNPNAVSRAGAQGIAQFMPATAARVGLDDPFDPAKALPKSAEHLADLQRRLGNEGLAAAAYNAGEGRVRAWLAGRSGLPLETQQYVRSITGRLAHEWAPEGVSLQLAPQTSLLLATPAAAGKSLPAFARLSAEWQLGAKLLGSGSRLVSLLTNAGDPSRRKPTSRAVAPPARLTGEKALCASMGKGCIVSAVY